MSVCDIARPEIRSLVPYDAAPPDKTFTKLNSNEAPASPYNSRLSGTGNRYPELRPRSLQTALADLFNVDRRCVSPTRGSSEGIDLLVRAFCRAYRDNIVVLPPTFDMYSAYATMQGVEVRNAPLLSGKHFSVDWNRLAQQCDENTRMIFLCSPNNPTGNTIPKNEILKFVASRKDKSVVVIDEAYIEFSDQPSLASDIGRHDNLVVLRTLSKAYALAGARCGAVLADESLICLISALMSPYAFSSPVTNIVLTALQSENRSAAEEQIANIKNERERMASTLAQLALVERVWPSSANFVLVKFTDGPSASDRLAAARLAIREFGDNPALRDCARITVGTADENDSLIAALKSDQDELK